MQFVEIITDYLEGRLTAADRTRVENHLLECDGCESYRQQMLAILAVLSQTPQPQIPVRRRTELAEAFRSASQLA